MKWGCFYPVDELPHVIPVDDAGYTLAPHIVELECKCHPVEDDGVIVHNEIH